jgi:hypothetical protein
MRGRSGARSVSRYDARIVEPVRLAALHDSLRVNATLEKLVEGLQDAIHRDSLRRGHL